MRAHKLGRLQEKQLPPDNRKNSALIDKNTVTGRPKFRIATSQESLDRGTAEDEPLRDGEWIRIPNGGGSNGMGGPVPHAAEAAPNGGRGQLGGGGAILGTDSLEAFDVEVRRSTRLIL